MSTGDDNVFARWSRRKQAVRYGETPDPIEEHTAREALEAVEPVDQPVPEEPGLGEPLPSLDDLTAESDLSAFLRKGVPEALRSAAFRKMWSLDPAIRDHVGLSEYAWDFNQPGSMAGFGPLPAGESVAEFLRTLSSGSPAGVAGADVLPDAPQSLRQAPDVPPGPHSRVKEDECAIPTGQPDLPDPKRPEPPQTGPAKIEAETVDTGNPPEGVKRKNHGGAMPL
jgi:hypothetical protein